SNQAVFNGTGGTGDVKQFMLTLENSDYYSLSLYAGQKATVGIRNLTGSGTTIAIKDEQGQTLSSAAPSVLLDQRISNFVAPADGRYYVLVSGNSSATYSLVVTRDLALDQEGNDTAGTAQPPGGTGAQ